LEVAPLFPISVNVRPKMAAKVILSLSKDDGFAKVAYFDRLRMLAR
jgi:hypothetical protein